MKTLITYLLLISAVFADRPIDIVQFLVCASTNDLAGIEERNQGLKPVILVMVTNAPNQLWRLLPTGGWTNVIADGVGGGDAAWTQDGDTLHQTVNYGTTNFGAVLIDTAAAGVALTVKGGDDASDIFGIVNQSDGPVVTVSADGTIRGNSGTGTYRLGQAGGMGSLTLSDGATDFVSLVPSQADGTTPFSFRSATLHTTGTIFDVGNTTSNAFTVYPDGSAYHGSSTFAKQGQPGARAVRPLYADYASEDFDAASIKLQIGSATYSEVGNFNVSVSTNSADLFLGVFGYGSIGMGFDGGPYFQIRDGVSTRFSVFPGASDGQPIVSMRPSTMHTSGNLFTIGNGGNSFAVTFDGAITTGDPGGGAGALKVGTASLTNVVATATNSIVITINGVAYAIPVKAL